MSLIRLILVIIVTAILGTIAILSCLVVPGGRTIIPQARLWSRLVLGLFRVRCQATYAPGLDRNRPCVYISNHQSQFDIPALVLSMPVTFRIVAKRGLVHVPIFGWALWLAGFVFIDRSDRDRAIRSLEKAAAKIRSGTSIVIFAEGTRSPDGGLLPFKKGGFVLALQAGVPIVPVAIRGSRAVMPKGSLRARPGIIEVSFGTPVETRDYTLDTKEALMDAVRERIESGLRSTSATRSGIQFCP